MKSKPIKPTPHLFGDEADKFLDDLRHNRDNYQISEKELEFVRNMLSKEIDKEKSKQLEDEGLRDYAVFSVKYDHLGIGAWNQESIWLSKSDAIEFKIKCQCKNSDEHYYLFKKIETEEDYE